MILTAVCSHCRYTDTDPNVQIDFKEGKIYYMCKNEKCGKESVVIFTVPQNPYPKSKRMR
jgi:hypothetical protein